MTTASDPIEFWTASLDAPQPDLEPRVDEPIPRTEQFTCVVNKKKSPVVLMNAIGHMTAGLMHQHRADTASMRFRDFFDMDGTVHPATSENGYVILRAENSNQLRRLRMELIERDIIFTDFTQTMVAGNYVTQQLEFSRLKEAELDYVGICFFENCEVSRTLTKRFSLYVNSPAT
jgi:hypothetical protein